MEIARETMRSSKAMPKTRVAGLISPMYIRNMHNTHKSKLAIPDIGRICEAARKLAGG